jgi:uncharacterized membrane protein YfcA
MSLLIVLTIVCCITYTIEIIFGLAGTIIMVTVMSVAYEAKTLVIYSILPQVLVGTIGLLRSPKTVNLKYLASMILFASIGGIFGLYFFYNISGTSFQLLLGLMITLFGLYLVTAPRIVRFGWPIQRLLDTIAGASQAMFGISGPIAMTRLLSSFNEKIVIRNYALAFFLSMNFFRGIGYISNNTFTYEVEEMMLFSGPFILVTLWYSNHIHFRINETLFRQTVSWMILLSGIYLSAYSLLEYFTL